MKKMLSIMLMLCMLIPFWARADSDGDMYAIVYNPILSDRLNLREKPSEDAETMGRYYTGTVVRIGEKGEEWSLVYIGKSAIQYGYMKNEYLVFFENSEDILYGHPGHGYQTGIFRAEIKDGAPLYLSYLKPGTPDAYAKGSEPFIVLGDVNDDYLHVQQGSKTYYVKRQDVTRRFNCGLAVVVSDTPQDRLNLRAAPESGSKVTGKVYAGAILSVQRLTGNGYAQITLVGEGRNCHVPMLEEQNDYLTCYVKEDYLRWGLRADLMGLGSYLPIAEVKRDTAYTYQMNNMNAKKDLLIRGCRMQVLGMRGNGDYLYVDLGETAPVLIKASDVRILTEYSSDGLPVLGYGIIANAQELLQEYGQVPYYADCSGTEAVYGCMEGDTVEILGLSDTWAQIRHWSTEGFIQRKYLETYLYEDMQFAYENDDAQGLCTYVCNAGDTLTLTWPDGHIMNYGVDAGNYTVYIPADAAVTLTGGEIRTAGLYGTFVSPESPVYQGSGRYLCGPQFMSRRGWGYLITPLDPDQPAWYRVSTFQSDDAGAGEKPVIVEPGAAKDPDQSVVYVEDGELLEFHNCIVEIYYGNG